MNYELFLFYNGVTAICDEQGNQVPELQVPWLLLYGQFLESKGIDPLLVKINLPNGDVAKFFRNSEGKLSWDLDKK